MKKPLPPVTSLDPKSGRTLRDNLRRARDLLAAADAIDQALHVGHAEAVEAEERRVFEICNGCRLCFNLCPSFPTLFSAVDALDSAPGAHPGSPAAPGQHAAGHQVFVERSQQVIGSEPAKQQIAARAAVEARATPEIVRRIGDLARKVGGTDGGGTGGARTGPGVGSRLLIGGVIGGA